jgi:hypothetical protein
LRQVRAADASRLDHGSYHHGGAHAYHHGSTRHCKADYSGHYHHSYYYRYPYFGWCWRPYWRTSCNIVIYPWWPSYAWDSYFSVGYYDDHWSVSLSWNRPYVSTYYGYSPVIVNRYYVYREVPAYYSYDVYDTVDRLIDKLRYGGAEERRDAARELGDWKSQRALYPLIYALDYDEDSLVRFYAAKSLGKLGAQEALPALRRAAAGDAELFVRDEAAEAVEAVETILD